MEFHQIKIILLGLSPIISLAGYSFLIQKLANYTFGNSLFLSICCIISINYFFGISEHLRLGQALTFWLGAMFFLWFSIKKFKLHAFFFTYRYLFFIPFILVFLAIPDNFIFSKWDEMSHWAPSIRYLTLKDQIYQDYNLIPFSSYPPGQQIFQYWFLKSSLLMWNEKIILYASCFFLLSGLLSISQSKLIEKKFALYFFYCAILIVLWGSKYGFDFAHIYADALLGTLFTCALFFAFSLGRRVIDAVFLGVILSALTLQKQTGVFLAFLILIFIIIQSIAIYRANPSKNGASNLISPLICIIFVLLTFISWTVYSKPFTTSNTIGFSNYSNLIHHATSALSPNILKHATEVWRNFLGKLNSPFLEIDLLRYQITIFAVGMIFSFASFISLAIFYLKRNGNYRTKKLITILSFTYLIFFLYIAYLLVVYIFLFVPYEGLLLASFERYIFTFLIAPILIILALIINYSNSHKLITRSIFLTSLFLLCISLVPSLTLKQLFTKFEVDENAVHIQNEELILLSKIPPNPNRPNRIYFIHQNSQGYEKYTFQYLALPNESTSSWWSIGKPYGANDIWTRDVNLIDLVNGYDYLAINNSDQKFWEENGKYFNATDIHSKNGVYLINLRANNPPYFSKIH